MDSTIASISLFAKQSLSRFFLVLHKFDANLLSTVPFFFSKPSRPISRPDCLTRFASSLPKALRLFLSLAPLTAKVSTHGIFSYFTLAEAAQKVSLRSCRFFFSLAVTTRFSQTVFTILGSAVFSTFFTIVRSQLSTPPHPLISTFRRPFFSPLQLEVQASLLSTQPIMSSLLASVTTRILSHPIFLQAFYVAFFFSAE